MSTEEDSESVSYDDLERRGGKCGMIFLIDARISMFTKDFTDGDNEEQSRFNIALKCCRTVLMNKIIAKEKDLIGVVLFGTDKPDPKTNTKHVSLLIELNYPNAESIKTLDKFLADSDSVELQRNYGSSDDFLLADALWYCSSLFSHSGGYFEEKRILLFTDDSEPHSSYVDRAYMARKRAKDLNQVNICLELLPMGMDFDYSKFYKELVEIVNGVSDSPLVDSSSRLEQLLERVNRLDFKPRRYSKIKWDLGNGVCLGVSLYIMFSEARIAPKEALYRATNEPVKRVRQMFNMTTGELLLPSDIVESVTVGGKDIVFSREEKEMMKKVMEPGLTLLGFKPRSEASEALHCGKAAFAYPEEQLVKGSRELMKALVERCIAKEKVALCCITPRHGAVTKYVFLVPSPETYDDAGIMITPCGFHVIPLPFYNDTRDQKFDRPPKIDGETIEIAKKLVNKLKFSYKPSSFKNPKLQQFWAHLEALALEYDAPDEIEDQTVPDADAQTERLGILADSFNNVCSLTGLQTFTTKRSSTSKGGSSPAKKAKSCDDVSKEIKAAIQIKKVEKFTVAQLKEFLISQGQNVSGLKKADLVSAVYNLKL